MLAVGKGLTRTLKVMGAPVQELKLGVTVICAVCGVVTKAAFTSKLPVPLVGNPIAGLLFVQVNVAEGVPSMVTLSGAPAQTACGPGSFTLGADTIENVKVSTGPGQGPVGVKMMVAVCGTLVAVKETLPEPLAGKPMLGLLFVQLINEDVPVMGILTGWLPQEAWLATGLTPSTAFTLILNVWGWPLQPASTGVTVNTEVWLVLGAPSVALMLPVPLAGKPVAVLLFVH